jgi:hypothetical protein
VSNDEHDPSLNHGYAYIDEHKTTLKNLASGSLMTRAYVTIMTPSNMQECGKEKGLLQVA